MATLQESVSKGHKNESTLSEKIHFTLLDNDTIAMVVLNDPELATQ